MGSDLFAAFRHFRSLPFPLFPTVRSIGVTHWFQSDMVELSLHPLYLAWSTQCHDACAYLFLRAGSPSLFQQRASVFSGLQLCFPFRSSE